MEKKYKFTNETKKVGGCVLHRIVAIRDFYNKRLGVIKKGTVGGYIESEENLCHDDGSWVMDDACAYEHARVDRNGIVAENARVYDYAYVSCTAIVKGHAHVHGHACVSGDSTVEGDTQVYENTRVFGNATINGNAKVAGDIEVSGHAVITGNAEVYGTTYSEVLDNARIEGRATVFGCLHAYGNAVLDNLAEINGCVYVCDNAHVGSVTLDGRDPYLMVCGDMDLHFPNNWKIIIGNEIKEVL